MSSSPPVSVEDKNDDKEEDRKGDIHITPTLSRLNFYFTCFFVFSALTL